MEQVERRRYHFQTIQPETIVDGLRDQGVQLVGLSIGLGDAYGLYVVECIACGASALLDAVEAVWGFDASEGGNRQLAGAGDDELLVLRS